MKNTPVPQYLEKKMKPKGGVLLINKSFGGFYFFYWDTSFKIYSSHFNDSSLISPDSKYSPELYFIIDVFCEI